MPLRLEDYAVLGNMRSAAVVGVDGSIDWLCLPRFDSGACFAAVLGTPENGRWLLAPAGEVAGRRHRYRGDTMVLETTFDTGDGEVRVVDAMPIPRDRDDRASTVLRVVEGVRGRVEMRSEVRPRFDYGSIVPWVHTVDRGLVAAAGPDAVLVDGDVRHERDDQAMTARFTVSAGDRVGLRLAWFPDGDEPPGPVDVSGGVEHAQRWWEDWAGQCGYTGVYRDAVLRSLLALKALAYGPTGGIVAAATTSLPEAIGGGRNWDYRYCWLRDATYTLLALLDAGYHEEATAWREWLLRALAGRPEQMQIMYAVDGRRRLNEVELGWLPGYEKSSPVRVGNAAHSQFQLDVYGELMDALHQARTNGIPPDDRALEVEGDLMEFLESHWQDPDDGMWEMRGPRRQFVHSKVMAWAAVDRAVKAARRYGLRGPVDRWKDLRGKIHAEVCEQGFDTERGTFTQFYGSKGLDASALQIPAVGFLPASDERVRGTVAAIERELVDGGFVLRYDPSADGGDGLAGREGAFLACTFWLADVYLLQGRIDDAREAFERVLDVRGATGLLTEEYDVQARRLVGNLPQAFSHVPLVTTALALTDQRGPGPVGRRSEEGSSADDG